MTREELLRCSEYWLTLMQNELARQLNSYMKKHDINKVQLMELIGCDMDYTTALLNGEVFPKIEDLIRISLKINVGPSINFTNLKL